MSKHTPKSWHFAAPIHMDSDTVVCSTPNLGDANRIAAALDLFDELEELRHEHPIELSEKVLEIIDDAIAKARGEA